MFHVLGLPCRQVRERTDALDALGNTTAATGKGFAIGSAVLTALALLSAFEKEVSSGAGAEMRADIISDRAVRNVIFRVQRGTPRESSVFGSVGWPAVTDVPRAGLGAFVLSTIEAT